MQTESSLRALDPAAAPQSSALTNLFKKIKIRTVNDTRGAFGGKRRNNHVGGFKRAKKP